MLNVTKTIATVCLFLIASSLGSARATASEGPSFEDDAITRDFVVTGEEIVISAERTVSAPNDPGIPYEGRTGITGHLGIIMPAPWLPHDPCPGNSFSGGYCWSDPPTEPDPTAPITIADVIALAPASAVPATEPGTFALRNLHTNFIADGTTHIRSGLLLGEPASAEFTPVAYEWHYGDGTTTTTRTPGATWQQLGRAEFDRTDTSHAYAEKGTYTVTLRTHYAVRASYASDGQWFQVPGTLTVTSAPLSIQVMTVKTVLVDKDCNQDPAGPGC